MEFAEFVCRKMKATTDGSAEMQEMHGDERCLLRNFLLSSLARVGLKFPELTALFRNFSGYPLDFFSSVNVEHVSRFSDPNVCCFPPRSVSKRSGVTFRYSQLQNSRINAYSEPVEDFGHLCKLSKPYVRKILPQGRRKNYEDIFLKPHKKVLQIFS